MGFCVIWEHLHSQLVIVKPLVSKRSFDHVGHIWLVLLIFPELFWIGIAAVVVLLFLSECKGYPTEGVEAKKTLWWYWRFGDSCSNSADGHWPVGALHTVQHSEKANDSEGVQAAG